MQDGAPLDRLLDDLGVARRDALGRGTQEAEEISVLDDRHLEGLGDPVEHHVVRQGPQELQVVDDGERWGEGANEVLDPAEVDPCLHPHAAVVLRQGGRGQPHQAHAAMHQRGPEADGVEERAAARRKHGAVAAQPVLHDLGRHRLRHAPAVFRLLPAWQDARLGQQIDAPPTVPRVGDNGVGESGMGINQAAVEVGQRLPSPPHDVRDDGIGHVEGTPGEVDGVGEGDADVLDEHAGLGCAALRLARLPASAGAHGVLLRFPTLERGCVRPDPPPPDATAGRPLEHRGE